MNIKQILNDLTSSNWLKTALSSALERDPIDVANDAEILAIVLINRANKMLGINTGD